MRKLSTLLIISVLLLSAVAVVSAGNQPEKVRVFLEFRGAPDVGPVALAGGKVLHSYQFLDNILAIEIPETALSGILMNPNVVGFELDAEVHTLAPPGACSPWPSCKDSDPEPDPDPEPTVQTLPWGVDQIDAELSNETGTGVTVCIVDTGVDKEHTDLNVAGGKNFVGKGKKIDPLKWDDDNGHGTHVAGTVAALDNTQDVVGVAPGATLLAAKVLDRTGSGYLSDVIAGVEYCVANGANVVSMSLGTSSNLATMEAAMDAAETAGVLLVAAAGNDYGGPVGYPAAYSTVVAVSATDSSNNLASFSNVGPEVELAAPGVNILSTKNGGGTETLSGTSMSTPHVSGVAALAWEANPLMSAADIRALLQSTSDDLGTPGVDNEFGYGLVDAQLS